MAERRRPTLGEAEEPPDLRPALGEQEESEQDAVFDSDEVEHGATATMIDLDEANPDVLDGVVPLDPDHASVEWLNETELREGETDDPLEATEEGLTYVPPVDPPVVPGEDGEPEVAAGFGDSALAEPYDADHHGELLPSDDEVSDRVREAIRAESATSEYADAIEVDTAGGIVRLRGVVADLVDEENLVAAAERVSGVSEVIDDLEVEGIG
jgi:hypothetical protein